MYAAPFAATLLADFGADVVKVEKPSAGDPLRSHQPFEGSESLVWAAVSRNKRSITLDLRTGKGQELFLQLLQDQDILFENFRPGTLDRWGLGIDRLRAANPDLVVVRVSGFGQTGPSREKAGFGTPATAFSGYAHMTGYPDRPPVLPPTPLTDYLSGVFAALGAVTALYHRDALDGGPQEVDVALYESLLRIMDLVVTPYHRLGLVRERTDNRAGGTAAGGLFESRDGRYLVMAASTDQTFQRLAELMDRTDMLTDPRFSTNRARINNRGEVKKIVADWYAAHDADEILRLCEEKGVPVERVNNIADIFAEPQVQARDMLVEIEHPSLGSVVVPGVVPKFSETPGEVRKAGPVLGEDNAEVYAGLGLTPEQIKTLEAEAVI